MPLPQLTRSEARLAVDNVVAPATVLLIIFVTTAYLIGASIAEQHVVATQAVDVVTELGAYDLLAILGADKVLARAIPLATTSAAAITASNSAVLLTVCSPSCSLDLFVPQPPLYIIGGWPRFQL